MIIQSHPSAPDYGQPGNATPSDEYKHIGKQKVRKNNGGQKSVRPKKTNQGPLSSGNNNTSGTNSSGSGDASGSGGSSQDPSNTKTSVGTWWWKCVSH